MAGNIGVVNNFSLKDPDVDLYLDFIDEILMKNLEERFSSYFEIYDPFNDDTKFEIDRDEKSENKDNFEFIR